MSHNIHCEACGEEFKEEDFQSLEYVSGFPYGPHDENGEMYRKDGYVEYRKCSQCGHDVVRRIDYDPEIDPPTERNPVPTMRPTPGVQ